MSFTDQQKADLAAPLSPKNVKTRKQSGRTLSYLEGWKAIEEANRIFGFDAWSRETVDLKCVSEREREIGENKVPGWGVTYIAKVRVTVGDVIRDGCGTGHGIDRDLGQAHESALKEAETDAMKRALMTFGNPFGLALYDKEQANVADDAPPAKPKYNQPTSGPQRLISSAADACPEAKDMMSKIDLCANSKALVTYGGTIAEDVLKLSISEQAIVRTHFGSKLKALKQAELMSA